MSPDGPVSIRRLSRALAYDGAQIGPLWAYRALGIQGDSLIAFVGRCSVPPRRMIDQEDVRRNARIAGPRMLHFVAEHFDAPPDLEKAVLRQRLFAVLAMEELRRRSRQKIRREGDDLFTGRGAKLSISVATVTPVSGKFHFGINVLRATGVGVVTAGLRELGVAAEDLADGLLLAYQRECARVWDARTRAKGAL